MRTIRVYIPQPLNTDKIVLVDKSVSHYLSRVLRLKPGHPLIVFNGEGGCFNATLQDGQSIQVGPYQPDQPTLLKLHLGQALCSQSKFDSILQKATELGVSEITPLITEFGQAKVSSEKLNRKKDHWQQILVHACQQCERNDLPTIHPPCSLDEWQHHLHPLNHKIVFHPSGETNLGDWSKQQSNVTALALLVGPEGGFSDNEITQLKNTHFSAITLGPRILRMETAAISALTAVQLLLGDL